MDRRSHEVDDREVAPDETEDHEVDDREVAPTTADASWPPEWLTTTAGPACPWCGGEARPIVDGKPGGELLDAVDAGRVAIAFGGCLVSDERSTHECVTCGERFSAPRRARSPRPRGRGPR